MVPVHVKYEKKGSVALIIFNRPEVRNAFRPQTTSELLKAFHDANEDTSIGVILLNKSKRPNVPEIASDIILPAK